MKKQTVATMFFCTLFLVSCIPINKTISMLPSLTTSPTLTPQQLLTTTIPTLSTPTNTMVPSPSVKSSPTEIDWNRLPKLMTVILSANDFGSINYGIIPNFISDITSEVEGQCYVDCAKFTYAVDSGTLTILLLRTGSDEIATKASENLRIDFVKKSAHEYNQDEIPNMPIGSWSNVDYFSCSRDFLTGAAGMSFGRIILLVTFSRNFCWYDPIEGRYCEGDAGELAWISVGYLAAQIKKLEEMGYPR